MHDANLESPMEMPRKFWTRRECRRLAEMGILDEREFELIEGDIICKARQSGSHVYVCMALLRALLKIFGENYVRLPAPVALDERNEPEPDASVTKDAAETYLRTGTPEPKDMRLIVEVADSTLSWDKTTKARIYNAAGIAEYWIINVKGRTAIVHRQPGSDGYGSIVTFSEDETISPLAAPGANLRVGDLLPAKTTKANVKKRTTRP